MAIEPKGPLLSPFPFGSLPPSLRPSSRVAFPPLFPLAWLVWLLRRHQTAAGGPRSTPRAELTEFRRRLFLWSAADEREGGTGIRQAGQDQRSHWIEDGRTVATTPLRLTFCFFLFPRPPFPLLPFSFPPLGARKGALSSSSSSSSSLPAHAGTTAFPPYQSTQVAR